MNKISLAKKIAFFSICALAVAVFNITPASALTLGKGYFTGNTQSSADGTTVLDSQNHTVDAIPEYVTSVDSLVSFLKQKYASSSAQDKTGSAFIVRTFLNNGASGSRTISTSDWDNFEQKMQSFEDAGLINWSRTISYNLTTVFGGVNSLYSPGINDDLFYHDGSGKNINAIYISNADGSFAYAIKYDCANPVGTPNISSLITTPTISISSESVLPGEKISWNHGVILSGSGSASSLKYQYRVYSAETGGSVTSSGSSIDNGARTAYFANISPAGYSEYTPTAADIGKTFCRSTYATTVINGVSSYAESDRRCATVGSNAATGSCRPIIINVPSHSYKPTYNSTSSLSITVVVKNNTTSKTISKSFTTATKWDVTTSCTTGDTYTVSITTPAHIESWVKKYRTCHRADGTPYRCNPYWVVSSRTSSSTATSIFGPCYDYLLKSSISALSNYQVEVGTTIQVTPYVASESWTYNNSRAFWDIYRSTALHTKSKTTEWQVSRLKVNSGKDIPPVTASVSPKNACDFYKSKGFDNCASEKTGSGTVFTNDNVAKILSGANALQTVSAAIGDEKAGTKICFAFSVKPSNSEDSNESATPRNEWFHSAIIPNKTNSTNSTNYCVIVVAKPKVQVLGGDIKVGRSFSSANSYFYNSNILTINSVKTVNGKLTTYGSWAEYALAAPGLIKGMASGSAFNGGMAADTALGVAATCKYSTLSFSNSNSASGCTSSTTIGSYSFNKKTIPDVSSSFPLSSVSNQKLSGNVNLDNLATGSYTANGNITITGGTLSAGKWIVINSPTITVKIANDVTYTTSTLKSLNDIPQLVIIAKNIQISNNVSRVDSWLIAKDGTLNTCSENMAGNLSTSDCKNLLTVNGPVMASELSLRRTAGSGTANRSGDPAEVFNLRADAYLWAYARASGSGRVWTVYTTNVPPRL